VEGEHGYLRYLLRLWIVNEGDQIKSRGCVDFTVNSTDNIYHYHHFTSTACHSDAAPSSGLLRVMARTISLSFGKDGKADGPEPATRPRSPTPQLEAGPSRSRSRLSSSSSLMSHDTKESSPAHSPPAETQFRSQGQDSDDQLWEADCILDERGPVATGQYLVQWVGHDPATGERWEPTWERREDVTPLLAKEWKDKKRADPGVVGVEGKKLEAERKSKIEAAKKEKKRKRDEKASQARKKAKARVARMSISSAGSRVLAGSDHQPVAVKSAQPALLPFRYLTAKAMQSPKDRDAD
jgi:hypothetical protein